MNDLDEIEVQHTMDIIADMVPYNTPNYWEVVRSQAEAIVRDMNKQCHETDWMVEAHDKWIEEHNDLPFC